jgi:hypothetical protein
MSHDPAYTLTFAPEVVDRFRAIERKYHSLIKREIHEQLRFTPDQATRNRKPLERPAPFSASWELRIGPNNRFRVFYEFDILDKSALILAIGIKEGNRLLIGGEEHIP